MVSSITDALTGNATAGEVERLIGLDVEVRSDHAPVTDFRRLVRLVHDNERLLSELETVRTKIQQAWMYLSEPGSNPTLAMTHLERLRMKRSALLAHLRSNRIEARLLVGKAVPDDEQIELN
ncbi:hypothetical protein [Tautonia rosea]|uniref:hypothetical protein n=1 Tax=Tautonia rosea TaxID=2728037 RepID=UPI0014767183|nr:hypothetical protein [Tautonia rosea]